MMRKADWDALERRIRAAPYLEGRLPDLREHANSERLRLLVVEECDPSVRPTL